MTTPMAAIVLVTGGAGFVGSHLCDALIDQGKTVICVDNLASGREVNIEHLIGRDDFVFVNADVRHRPELPTLGQIESVLHFASLASPPEYLAQPLLTLETGSIGTQWCLDLAEANGARFIMASTSEIYGDPEVHPQREDYWGNVNPIGPRSVYDEAKRYAEAITMAYARSRGVNTGIVRIFNTYGPRMRADDGRVVSNFINQAIVGEPLTVYGDGNQTRSYCYVSDLVAGIMALLNSDLVEPVNLGNPSERTVKNLADSIIRLTNSSSGVTYHDLPLDDPTRRRPDVQRANTMLGWHPQVELEEGLAETIAYFRESMATNPAGL